MSRKEERLEGDPWPRSPVAGQIVLDWPRRYEVEVLGSQPPPEATEYGFSYGGDRKAARFVVYPMGGEPWVGVFAGGHMNTFLASTVTNGPEEDWLTVVATGNAYLVNVFNPNQWTEVDVDPVMDVRAITDGGLVVFADFTELTAYDAGGMKWRTDRLAYDGLRIDRIDASGIHGVGWNAPTERLLPFVIDPATGRGTSEAYP